MITWAEVPLIPRNGAFVLQVAQKKEKRPEPMGEEKDGKLCVARTHTHTHTRRQNTTRAGSTLPPPLLPAVYASIKHSLTHQELYSSGYKHSYYHIWTYKPRFYSLTHQELYNLYSPVLDLESLLGLGDHTKALACHIQECCPYMVINHTEPLRSSSPAERPAKAASASRS